MRLRHEFAKCVALGSLALLGMLPTRSMADIIAASRFSVNDEGWRLSGDVTSAVPTYLAAGGNPGGFIRGFDQTVGGVWFWDAPGPFLGNVAAAYGFPLTYDLRMRG